MLMAVSYTHLQEIKHNQTTVKTYTSRFFPENITAEKVFDNLSLGLSLIHILNPPFKEKGHRIFILLIIVYL